MPSLRLELRRRILGTDGQGYTRWAVHTERQEWPCGRTALLLCDVWDRHWSRGACERLEAMVPRMDKLVRHARERGVQIVHAPSDTMEYYAGTPARQRILAVAPVEPPPDLPHEDPPLPVDASDHGSDTGEKAPFRAWQSQHRGIGVDAERDVVSDSGQEILAYLRACGLERLLILGVHTNMCVLHRSFGIKQMVRWGVPVALVRDLTDTMYNPARPPYVDHDEGTRLVVEYIERFWCPSVHSQEVLAS
ncbi:MAG: isochorismatase family protein [Candidatus Latescibacterota bacterium]